jgi:hypothetical protein
MKSLITPAIAACMLTSSALAASLLSEQQARTKAVDILQGAPYGATPAEVTRKIKQVQFLSDGITKACGPKKRAAWEFHVVVVTADKEQFSKGVIDGYLALDARSGKLLCTNLPLLD